MKRTGIIAIAILLSQLVFAQVSIEKRIEIEVEEAYYITDIVNLKQNGFMVVTDKNIPHSKDKERKFNLYDTDLELIKSKSITISHKNRASLSFIDENNMFSFIMDKKGRFMLSRMEIPSMEISDIEGELYKRTVFHDMKILGDYAYFEANIKGEAHVLIINWKNGEKNMISMTLKAKGIKRTVLNRIQLLEETDEILAFVTALKRAKEADQYVIRIDDRGNKTETFNLSEESSYDVDYVTASAIDDNKLIYTGTYSENVKSGTIGLFVCMTKNGELEYMNFYKFTELENFFSYLSEKRQEKIDKKIEKKKRKGKDYSPTYLIAAHNIISIPDGYLFLGEAFYPTYRTETYTTTTTVNGQTQTTTHTRTVFDGYQYTHAVLTKFNNKGELVWDQTFKMYPSYKPFVVKKFISVSGQSDNSIKLVFGSGERIYSKKFDFEGKILEDKESEEIETLNKGDKVRASYNQTDYWYDNYFFVTGKQRIKNKKNKDVKKKRTVFFVAKVKF